MPITTTGVGGSGIGGGGSAPVNTVAPVVSGGTILGNTLTTTNGTWNNSPTQFDYQWYSGSTPVGTDLPTYTTLITDVGNQIYCVVTASNTAGSGTAQSNSVGPITNGGGGLIGSPIGILLANTYATGGGDGGNTGKSIGLLLSNTYSS